MSTPEPEATPTQEQPAAGPPPPPPPGGDPWVAPPRQLWINPQKRTSVIVASVVAALVLLGAGAIGGAAISDHRDHHRFVTVLPGNGAGPRGPGYGQPFRNFPKRLPMPNPTPSPTKTS